MRSGRSAALAAFTLALAIGPVAAMPRPAGPAESIGEIANRIGTCWRPPTGLAGVERLEQTVRLSLARDGKLIGEPRVTFVAAERDSTMRERLVRSAIDAVRRCTPVAMTTGLAGALAGRPFTIRLIYAGPRARSS